MKNYWTLILFVCTTIFSFAQLTNKSISVSGANRAYIEYLPINLQATESLPLIIVLHGLGGTSAQMTPAGFNEIADTARCIVVYPQALNNGFGQAAWNNGTALGSGANDVEFMNQLINVYILQYNCDPERVYATGFSMGGIMTHRLGLALNHRIAAIGPMAGTLSTPDSNLPAPVFQTPVIHLHGTDDGTVPYDENPLPSLTLVPETMSFWRNAHNCDATADSIRIPDVANDSITIDRFVYHNCDVNGRVELWRFNGADHIYLYEPAHDITESKVIWNFFRQYRHPNPSTASLAKKSFSSFSVSPNPTNGVVRISAIKEGELRLINSSGKVIQNFYLTVGENMLKMTVSPGVYFLQSKQQTMKLVVH